MNGGIAGMLSLFAMGLCAACGADGTENVVADAGTGASSGGGNGGAGGTGGTASSGGAGGAAPSATNALYVWWHGYEILQHQAERDNLLRIANAEQVNLAYVAINEDSITAFQPGFGDTEDAWQTLIDQAHAAGVEVHALLGGTTSVFTDMTHDGYVETILQFNAEHPESRISGIVFDIEPQIDGMVAGLTEYVQRLKAVSVGGETLGSQGVTLSIYIDAPQWLSQNVGADYPSIIALYHEFDVIGLNSYQSTLDDVIFQAADAPDVFEQEGIPFLIGLETDDAWSYTPGTLFDEGKDAYHALQGAIDQHMRHSYTTFVGQYTDHYQKSISWWHDIRNVTWPSGTLQAGASASATVELVRSDSYPAGPVGLRMKVSNGTYVAEVSKVVVLGGVEARSVSLAWPLPDAAPAGAYDVELSTWEIDLENDSRRSTLYYVDFSGVQADLEAVDLAELEAMAGLTGLRTPFVPLDRVSQSAAFTVGN